MTGKVITLQQLINASYDADSLADIINGAAWVEIETRLGRKCYSIATISAIITRLLEKEELGEAQIAQSVQNIANKAAQARVDIDGLVAEFDTEKDALLVQLQNAIDVALAAGAGAAGWTDSLIQTESGKNLREFNSIAFKNVVYPEMFGKLDSQGYADTMFNNMINLLNTILLNPCIVECNSVYKFKTELNSIRRGDIVFDFRKGGVHTPDDYTAGVIDHRAVFNFYGGGLDVNVKTKADAATNLTVGLLTIAVADASQFKHGDYIAITSSGEYFNGIQGVSGYDVYFKGEMNRIYNVSGNTITLYTGLRESYLTQEYTVTIQKLNMIENITIYDSEDNRGKGKFTETTFANSLAIAFFECCNNVTIHGGVYEDFTNYVYMSNVGMNHCKRPLNPTFSNSLIPR